LNGDGRDAQQLLPDRRRKLEFNFEVQHPADPGESNAERLLFSLEISGLKVSRGSEAAHQQVLNDRLYRARCGRR
jgi:hypothetical protein